MDAAGWGELLIIVVLVAGLPGAYALRRAATLPGLVTLAAVTYMLFALWFFLSLGYVLQLYGVLGEFPTTLWPAILTLVGIALADVLAAWGGWRWHRKLYPPNPRGEQVHPADGVRSE